ncbi:MAG: four helix bundle protein [Prevotella sp.]|nr:four helix bundle protein [Prevotella sp.]
MEFNFRKLNVYYSALDLVEYVYEKAGHFPKEEKYALSDQLRRAVVSVPSNIVEGVGRATDKDKAHFVSMAYTSLMEVLCQMEIAYRVKYISEDEFRTAEQRIETVAKMLSGLRKSFEKSLNSKL